VQLPPVIRNGAKCKSGGVVVFVKSSIFVIIEVLKSSSENVLWFILKDVLYAPVLFSAMYIPPENNIYSSIDFCDVTEDDILKFVAEKTCKVCLLGDLNARSGTKDNFVNLDDYVCNTVQLDDVLKQEFDLVNLDKLGINCKRVSLDKFVNNYGNRLLMLCQNLNLLIANGRLGKDKSVGAFACKESSLVDYCILTSEFFSYVVNFEILPFDPMLSDCHNALYLEFYYKSRRNKR
jgi:hypothetical protein